MSAKTEGTPRTDAAFKKGNYAGKEFYEFACALEREAADLRRELEGARNRVIEECAKVCDELETKPDMDLDNDDGRGYDLYALALSQASQRIRALTEPQQSAQATDEQGRPLTYWGGMAQENAEGRRIGGLSNSVSADSDALTVAVDQPSVVIAPSAPDSVAVLTDEQCAAAVRAWFGDTDCPPVSKDFINRMRRALTAASAKDQ